MSSRAVVVGFALLLAGCASSSQLLWEEYTALGAASVAVGDYRQADQFLNRALVKAGGLGPAEQGISLNGLGELYRRQRRYADAEQMFTRSLALKETAHGPDHPDVATTLTNLGLVYAAEGRHRDAVPVLERALRIQDQASTRNATLDRTLAALSEAYRQTGHAEKAREMDARRRGLRESPAPRP